MSTDASTRLPDIAAEIAALLPAVIVASGQPAARAIVKVSGTIPVVLAAITYPIGLGILETYARPGATSPGS